jgi:hypothetical protein
MTSLLDARTKLGALLAPVADSDPNVLTSLVDAIEPPALMLGWGEPWITSPGTMCAYSGHLVVTAVAARLMPGEGLAMLESLVHYTLARIATEPQNYVLENVTGPRVFLIAKTNYIACRITIGATVDA